MRCLFDGCPGDMRGQMVVCPPHWVYLSEGLRREAVAVRNELDAQLAEGNPRRATRDAWRALLPRITLELVTAHAALEQELGNPVAPGGLAWRDASRRIKARAAEAATASEAASA
jgi:hypothetical protein